MQQFGAGDLSELNFFCEHTRNKRGDISDPWTRNIHLYPVVCDIQFLFSAEMMRSKSLLDVFLFFPRCVRPRDIRVVDLARKRTTWLKIVHFVNTSKCIYVQITIGLQIPLYPVWTWRGWFIYIYIYIYMMRPREIFAAMTWMRFSGLAFQQKLNSHTECACFLKSARKDVHPMEMNIFASRPLPDTQQKDRYTRNTEHKNLQLGRCLYFWIKFYFSCIEILKWRRNKTQSAVVKISPVQW